MCWSIDKNIVQRFRNLVFFFFGSKGLVFIVILQYIIIISSENGLQVLEFRGFKLCLCWSFVFVSIVLFRYRYIYLLFVVWGCFRVTLVEWSGFDRGCVVYRVGMFYIWSLLERLVVLLDVWRSRFVLQRVRCVFQAG